MGEVEKRHVVSEPLESRLDALADREKKVIAMEYGISGYEKHSLEEIAVAFNVPVARIRQIEARALRKLQRPTRRR